MFKLKTAGICEIAFLVAAGIDRTKNDGDCRCYHNTSRIQHCQYTRRKPDIFGNSIPVLAALWMCMLALDYFLHIIERFYQHFTGLR